MGHWPNGQCQIQGADGSLYNGMVEKGVRHGKGCMTKLDKSVYQGDYANGKRHGQGLFTIQGCNYRLESEFEDDKPTI